MLGPVEILNVDVVYASVQRIAPLTKCKIEMH